MKQADWEERLRKREQRTLHRERLLERQRLLLERKQRDSERSAIEKAAAAEALRNDNKKTVETDKRPGADMFLQMYSFVPTSRFDKRHCIPHGWTSRSFNKRRQHIEFFKTFIYPYPVPDALLFTSLQQEYVIDERGKRIKMPYRGLIKLAKQWLSDLVSGESFYKRNKTYFTRAEARYFICSNLPYADETSVIKQMFLAKCKARKMSAKLCKTVSDVFANKFLPDFNNGIVTGFLDLIARTDNHRFDSDELGDICDFVLEKIRKHRSARGRLELFSFSGRTAASVIALVNEWHGELQRERKTQADIERARNKQDNSEPLDISHWRGLGIAQFSHKTDSGLWTVSELLTSQSLVNEGRKMKNCVASYAYKCAENISALFSVSQYYSENQITDNVATIEVRIADRSLVQAKGKCNTKVSGAALNVITRWAQISRIRIRLL
jgi:hypothetical protein